MDPRALRSRRPSRFRSSPAAAAFRSQPDAPGQFALADQSRIHRILKESGWVEIDIQPVDLVCTFPEKELVRYLTLIGPIGRLFQESDEPARRQIIETVRPAFDPYIHGADVRFSAACWRVGARAPSQVRSGGGSKALTQA